MCNKQFTRKDYIKDHMINVHGMLMMRGQEKSLIETSLLPESLDTETDLDLSPHTAVHLKEFMRSETIL